MTWVGKKCGKRAYSRIFGDSREKAFWERERVVEVGTSPHRGVERLLVNMSPLPTTSNGGREKPVLSITVLTVYCCGAFTSTFYPPNCVYYCGEAGKATPSPLLN